MSRFAPLMLLVDGHSLAFRAYYALAKNSKGPLRNAQGIPTSVCFGFLNSLVQTLETLKPQAVAIAFDRREPTFRHVLDARYKGDRQPPPEDFAVDLNNLYQLLEALNLPRITYAGYEADDILGTLAHQGVEAGYEVKILSGDRDLFQLVSDCAPISVLYLSPPSRQKNQTYTEFHEADVLEKMGVTPQQIVDYKALCGDKSDSIPGVAGIGEKTAIKLLQQYGDLETIYANLKDLTGVLPGKLKSGQSEAHRSQALARIVTNIPLQLELASLNLQGFQADTVIPLLQALELKTFVDKINSLQIHLGGQGKETPLPGLFPCLDSQLSLFPSSSLPIVPLETALTPRLICQPQQLTELIAILKNNSVPVAWDTETSGLNPFQSKLIGIGCAWGAAVDQVAYIPLGHKTGNQLPKNWVLQQLEPLLSSPNYAKVFQNAKFDRLVFRHHGLELRGVVFDTLLASYVLQPELNHNLTELCRRYLSGTIAYSYKDLGLSKEQTLADLDPSNAALYCALDAHATFLLRPILAQELAQIPSLQSLFQAVEMPLEPILATMEDRGIRIDQVYLQELATQMQADLVDIERAAYQAAGESFNLASPKQLGEILFEKLGLDRKKSRKTKTGYSTDHATLEKLQGDHPLIDHILDHRTLAKLKSTYVDALPSLVEPHTQRLHTDFNQAVTATGRLSSSNPNLQNIPIRTEFSRRIRRAFIPETGWLLVSADYSQIELRILAHLSQEPLLIEAYQTGQDVHRLTAQLLLDKTDISPQERNLGKTINFGVIYGMGAQRFARETGVSAAVGKEFIERYHRNYPQIFNYLETTQKTAIAEGFVTTLQGRRRYFEFIGEELQQLRGTRAQDIDLKQLRLNYQDAQKLRGAANAPIQGSSADIIKLAMVKLAPQLEPYSAQLLLQVHDELILEMPPQEWPILKPLIQTTMEEAVCLSVPLQVEIRQGQNWLEAK